MKKFILALCCGSVLFGAKLDEHLSPTYKELFDTELQKSFVESKFNSLSWISPVTLSFQRNWSNQVGEGWNPYNVYSIGIEQPIFRSGGIYYGIKFAKSNFNLAKASTLAQKIKLNVSAIELLYQIKQMNLNKQKLKLSIKNAQIEIKRAKELFEAGLFSSVELDNALIKADSAKISLLEVESSLVKLKSAYRKISGKSANSSNLPRVKMPTKDEFLGQNIEIDIAEARKISSRYNAKVVRSKYLPTVSVGARYSKISNPQPGTKDAFTNYSLSVSMPLSVNTSNDMEIAKLDTIINGIKAKQTRFEQSVDYDSVLKRVRVINRKIEVAKKEANSYKRLLKSTKSLYKAGQKSVDDLNLIKNSYEIKRLDVKIYELDKSLEILSLHQKIR